jgi:hypothetical protein
MAGWGGFGANGNRRGVVFYQGSLKEVTVEQVARNQTNLTAEDRERTAMKPAQTGQPDAAAGGV